MIPSEELLPKFFVPEILFSERATAELKKIVSGKIKEEVCGRAKKNTENWTWSHVRRAMAKMGFFGKIPENRLKTIAERENDMVSDKEFGYAINICDRSITPGSVKTQCINHDKKMNTKEIVEENIVRRICEYLQPIQDIIDEEKAQK